jgi:uncharacterized protein (TIGR00251 family)
VAVKIEIVPGGVKLFVKVVPGASRDRIVGELGDALKIAVSRPPEDGAANRAVIELLSDALGLPARDIALIAGQTNPRKQFRILGLTIQQVTQRLGL